MKRLLTLALFLGLVVPAAQAAPPAGQNDDAAAKKCKAERGATATTRAAFDDNYGTGKNKRNAFGKCVSSQSKDDDEADDVEAQNADNAAKKCKEERGTTATSRAAFENTYGTNANKRNAFGKCVSKHAKEKPKRS